MHPARRLAVASLALLAATASLAANPRVDNDDILQSTARFDMVVADASATPQPQPLRPLENGSRAFILPGFSIHANDGRPRLVDGDDNQRRADGLVGALPGGVVAIVPRAPAAGSGLRFRFDQPVHGVGIAVGDDLVAGGTIRHAQLPLGSVEAVPELPTVALWPAGLLALAQPGRRRGSRRRPRWNDLQRPHWRRRRPAQPPSCALAKRASRQAIASRMPRSRAMSMKARLSGEPWLSMVWSMSSAMRSAVGMPWMS